MNELLSVVIDFNTEVLDRIDLEVFVSSVLKFLNCFRMQSGLNQTRIYVAFASNSFLLYPLEGLSVSRSSPAVDLQDMAKMQSMSFEDVKTCLLERILRILENEKFH